MGQAVYRVADAIVDTLAEMNVGFVTGIPGGGMMPILDALYGRERPRFILTRHEQASAYMAHGYGRATGNPAVCLVTKAPGATNLAIGVNGAYTDSTPMLILSCGVSSRHQGWGAFEEMDFVNFFRPITKWSALVPRPERVPEMLRTAYRAAMTGRKRPANLTIPADFPGLPYEGPPLVPIARAVPRSRPCPDVESVREAARLLASAQRPVLFAGGGVDISDAGQEVIELAERLGAAIATTWQKKPVPSDHPLNVGQTGLAGTEASRAAFAEADLIFAIGCRFSEDSTAGYRFTPSPGMKIIHLDIDPEEIGKIYPVDLGIACDAREGLRAILAEMEKHQLFPGPDEVQRRSERIAAWKKAWEDKLEAVPWDADPLRQPRVLRELRQLADPDAILVLDSGNFIHYATRYWINRFPRSYIYPTGGTMGFALPGGLGVKLAHPDRQVICLAGDGGFAMTLQELETAVRERLPVMVVVLNNMALGNIRLRQEVAYGGRLIGSTYGNPKFAEVARAFGCVGLEVSRAQALRPTLEQALRAVKEGKPAVVDVLVDPNDNCRATVESWW